MCPESTVNPAAWPLPDDPWSDRRPRDVREEERKQRFAAVNDAVHLLAGFDAELNKQRLRRFSRLTMTAAELKAEIGQLEHLIALMETYPESPARDRGIAYYAEELRVALNHAERMTRAAKHRLGKGPDPETSADFARAKLVDVVALAELLTAQKATRSGRNFVMACPFHADDSPSLTLYEPGLGWFCFGCGQGGDAVAFAAAWFQCSQSEALRWVEELCDLPEAT